MCQVKKEINLILIKLSNQKIKYNNYVVDDLNSSAAPAVPLIADDATASHRLSCCVRCSCSYCIS